MKKNLLSVIILALLVVNIALTGVMMFSTISANNKTIALVNQIAAILDLEVKGMSNNQQPSLLETETYNIADELIISLKHGEDGMDHYALACVSFSLDTTNEDYATYQPMLAEKESKIISEINNIFAKYTKEEATQNQNAISDEILERLQEMFDSDFIYEVYFKELKFQ